eukprot:CAMPEP_0182417664 /NCGR_PEP_ID=MMETSP1167-20130531/2108_1 /TAXON_ID=2988 /ORGANISM="Mallomonas Sp, Strain CCMP3275" /LENGTH=362 /DNA_ID=CAMNT_0024591369 /DNA_START=305 /DNA_END=1393 /DNA_ORIENTATION=+
MRKFAEDYIYSKPRHADFFAISLITLIVSLSSIFFMLYWQMSTGRLQWWMVTIYYFCWVGFGGRIMGAAYTLAHKEGHTHTLYKSWFRNIFGGHIFENILGVFFGNVPWNFTTSHIFIHHRLDGGLGDTFYLWDLDRSSMYDFMLYLYRVLQHTSGFSSVAFFKRQGHHSKAKQLSEGIMIYWVVALVLLMLTRSVMFVVFIYLQPFFCMTFFLALINIGFHGFLEFDESGKHVPEVDATTIIDGDDDYFGEDDHMAHHYNTTVYYRDLPELHKKKEEIFKKNRASVFQKVSIFELSILIVLGQWEKLAEIYVDYSGSMTKPEIMSMLRRRAKLKEAVYDLDKLEETSTLSIIDAPAVKKLE